MGDTIALLDESPLLASVFNTSTTWALGGAQIPLDSVITPMNAQRLFDVVTKTRPARVLEIGMAQGVSTVAILTALEHLGAGSLVSIDPFETKDWQGAGLELVRRSGLASRHQLIEEPDYYALPKLMQQDYVCDLAYIDGKHCFEFTFIDFFFIDRILGANGLVGFNDCGMPAVQKVLRYMASHTPYAEEFHEKIPWVKRRKMKFWEFPDKWFRKVRAHTVPWDYYKDF